MPIGPTKTKEQKQAVVHTEMKKFKGGDLHSGSKKGPVVHNREQAIAIAMSESGQSKKKNNKSEAAHQPHPKTNPGEYDTEPHGRGESNAAMPNESHAQSQSCGGEPHTFRGANHHAAHGYGHDVTQRNGSLRNSGHSGAHRIGKR